MEIDDLLFVGFNKRVAALDPHSGEVMWDWKAPRGTGFVTLLLDRGTLFAAVQGFLYALDPKSGSEIWANPMKGFGYGVTSIATTRSSTSDALIAEAKAARARQAASQQHYGHS